MSDNETPQSPKPARQEQVQQQGENSATNQDEKATHQEQKPPERKPFSSPTHMMTHDVKTKDGRIFPNRIGPARMDKDGQIKGRIDMVPLNGDVTTQTYERYLEKLREYRQANREAYQQRDQDRERE